MITRPSNLDASLSALQEAVKCMDETACDYTDWRMPAERQLVLRDLHTVRCIMSRLQLLRETGRG